MTSGRGSDTIDLSTRNLRSSSSCVRDHGGDVAMRIDLRGSGHQRRVIAGEIVARDPLEGRDVDVEAFGLVQHLHERVRAEAEVVGGGRHPRLERIAERADVLGERVETRAELVAQRRIGQRRERLLRVVAEELDRPAADHDAGLEPRLRQRRLEVLRGLLVVRGRRFARAQHGGGALGGRCVIARDVRVERELEEVEERIAERPAPHVELEQLLGDLAPHERALDPPLR
jgi:hypothetical protein